MTPSSTSYHSLVHSSFSSRRGLVPWGSRCQVIVQVAGAQRVGSTPGRGGAGAHVSPFHTPTPSSVPERGTEGAPRPTLCRPWAVLCSSLDPCCRCDCESVGRGEPLPLFLHPHLLGSWDCGFTFVGKGAQNQEVQDVIRRHGADLGRCLILSDLVFCFLRRPVQGVFGTLLGFGIWAVSPSTKFSLGLSFPPPCRGFMRIQRHC